ncbi:MAG: hypothetical protein IK079_01220, partial [Desulfovibrio sp.]|nr:hypothetical protein [Desulfovibrio sp.]
MLETCSILPTYAADTSGVCSALYELKGMIVVHDASGCNSTYSTFDEPRWFDMPSHIFISGLTEMEAILGEDAQRLIHDVCTHAKNLAPNFIVLINSPMPLLIGTDLEEVANEITARSHIPCMAIKTTGMAPYTTGLSHGWCTLAKHFVHASPKTKQPSVNLLGLSPLDFSDPKTVEHLRAWLINHDLCLNCSLAMDTDF